jgi:hypothetical protein
MQDERSFAAAQDDKPKIVANSSVSHRNKRNMERS